MINNKLLKKFLSLAVIIIGILFFRLVLAQDFGIDPVSTGLDGTLAEGDPRTIAGRIINVILGLLGIIAVSLIIYAGFLWMTSAGEEEKVSRAKKLLTSAVIGLVIILASWAIATFLINKLSEATYGPPGGSSCITGDTMPCGCGGTMYCTNGSWSGCIGSNCGGGTGPTTCSTSFNSCEPNDDICSEQDYCDSNCTCRPRGSIGDSCNNNAGGGVCSANDNLCGAFLTCDQDSCLCTGPPVITGISPAGGFCENNNNQACQLDSDCGSGLCDKNTPNGTPGNFITISGRNFGEYQESLSQVYFMGGSGFLGRNPSELNGACVNFWSDKQIIIAVPEGVASGPIRVIREDGAEDLSNDNFGPLLPDFLANNIVRPGLCLLTPDSGELNALVTYQGVNLFSGQAYFGNYQNNVAALNSNFGASGFSGMANAPNIRNGESSSFVISNLGGNNQASNFLQFTKEADPKDGPYIISFSPTQGRSGQYVTIIGNGFGNFKGSSSVYFGDTEANYEFPPICANSIWNDTQIIVKVPDGLVNNNYLLKIALSGGDIIDTQNLSPNVFKVDDNLPLKTSLCKIEPNQGSVATPVKVYGEYFGNVGSTGLVRFNNNKDAEGTIGKENGADSIAVTVPAESITGPVKVIKAGDWGNELNFSVGICTSDSQCPGQVCCPANTYKNGRCVDNILDCLIEIPNSVFEWKFNTGYDNPGDQESCATLANYYGACQTGYLCPNVPGVCSPYAGGSPKVVASCDFSCASINGCSSGLGGPSNCSYNPEINKCVYDNYTCDLSNIQNFVIEGQEFTFNVTCNQDGNWQLTSNTSCPDGWERGVNNICVDKSSNCNSCNSGLNCIQVGTGGRCASNNICPSGAECKADLTGISDGECVMLDNPSCDCCCRVSNSNEDCCFPLTCAGACGNDPTGEVYGRCSGCALAGGTQAEQDAACNCTGHSGQYCSITPDRPEGVCVDCTALTSLEACNGATSCCFDHSTGRCQGGSKIADGINAGYCAYYDCDSNNTQCIPENEPKLSGQFKNYSTCVNRCGSNQGGAGLQCNTNLTTQTCNFNICSFPAMACLTSAGTQAQDISDCGACCCDASSPEDCSIISPNLYCKPDQGNCSGPNRGLCCGCENDGQCGNINTTGCGVDTCCQARPQVLSSSPESGSDNVCRNAAIQVVFNQAMDVATFNNNVILFREMPIGSGVCPPGTFVYSNNEDFEFIPPNRLSLFFRNVKISLQKIFKPINFKNNNVLANPPDINKLYCSTPINISGDHVINEGSSFSTINILPRKLLDPDASYFLVIKGDENLNSQLGVLSIQGVGFNGEGLNLGGGWTEGEYYTFNSTTYKNSHIIQFRTLADSTANSGICAINQVKLNPSSYLFRTTQNSLIENDNNPNDKTFDTANDKDKVFVAWAYSADGQVIQPVTGYFWRWDFNLTNDEIASQKVVSNLGANRSFIEAKEGVTDGRTVLLGTVNMDNFLNPTSNPSPDCVCTTDLCPENCRNAFSIGDGLFGASNIYVFICNNPWPPVKPDGTWSPWQDNCDTAVSPDCSNFNYSFYYCRDAGQPGTFDDLPAINPQAVILGQSAVLACSADGAPCNSLNSPCGQDRNGDGQPDGVCIWGVLKESYFFRANPIYPAQINNLVDKQTGGTIEISWQSTRDQVTAYKIYFGETGRSITNFIEIEANSSACSAVEDDYHCFYTISNLTNNKSYTFRVSTLSASRSESVLSSEARVIPTDKTPPQIPADFNYEIIVNPEVVRFTWVRNDEEALFYRLYRGVNSGIYGESIDSNNLANSMDFPLNALSLGNNYFALSALDSSNNESEKTFDILIVAPVFSAD